MLRLPSGLLPLGASALAPLYHLLRETALLPEVASLPPAGRAYAKAARKSASAQQVATAQQSAKLAAIEEAVQSINSKFGQGTLMRMGESAAARIARTSSGCWPLDIALGGGWPKGRIIEIYGPESSGKTTLALHAIAQVQRVGGTAILVDAEHAFNEVYAANLGVNVKDLLINQPQTGEEALQIVDELARSGAADLVAVDSVAALAPKAEVEGEMGSQLVGAQARLMSSALRKLTGNAARMGCTIIFLNQIRNKVGVLYGSPEVTSGGNALKFYASARVDVRRKETLEDSKQAIGIRVKARVVKNKTAPPYRSAEFNILFDKGIDALGCLLETAEALGIATRRGSYYYVGEQKLGQGKDKAAAAMAEDSKLRDHVETLIRDAMLDSTALANSGHEQQEAAEVEEDLPAAVEVAQAASA